MAGDPNYAERLENRRHVDAARGFKVHATIFALVVLGLALVNLLSGPPYWFQWVLLGWGAGVAAHGFSVYRNRNKRVTPAERSKLGSD
ncbi:MAG: 2TM domain-containing protein [Hyphomicrobiaceae bacterium]|nr:2TM domain-containing protein [Hyphomicrobiaceae bacterium]